MRIDAGTARLREAFRQEQMCQLPLVEEAMGRQALALLRHLDAACQSADDLQAAATESFNQHPDAGIITSFPGIGTLTGARVLAETGDDRSRFADAKGLKVYAGAAPVTRASGKTRSVTRRHVNNDRLATPGPSPPSPHHQAPAPTTTAAARPVTATPPRSATSTAASPAASGTPPVAGRPALAPRQRSPSGIQSHSARPASPYPRRTPATLGRARLKAA
jgi:hypothetical protein